MNYYYLVERDKLQLSWAVTLLRKPLPKRTRSPALPPVLYRFLGPVTEGEMALKSEYAGVACKTCGRCDDDAIFDMGFCDPVTIRFKYDFGYTDDRVFAISQKLLNVLCEARVRGFETKPLGSSGWHAMRVTDRVDCDEKVMELIGPFCSECGRADRIPGAFTKLDQVALPSHSNAIFTTKKGWAKPFRDRDTFLTEDVVKLLKNAGIRGGWCNRLWTREEVCMMDEMAKRGKKWKPPGSIVTL